MSCLIFTVTVGLILIRGGKRERGIQRAEGGATAEFLMKLWLRFLCMWDCSSCLHRLCQWGCASSTAIKPTGASWVFNFFLIILRKAAAFPLLKDEEFLYLLLALALKSQRNRKSTEQAFCARAFHEWGDHSSRDTKFMGLWSCTGGKLKKLSKPTCPSGPEPQCPGSRVVTDSACPGKCPTWNKTCGRTVASSIVFCQQL